MAKKDHFHLMALAFELDLVSVVDENASLKSPLKSHCFRAPSRRIHVRVNMTSTRRVVEMLLRLLLLLM